MVAPGPKEITLAKQLDVNIILNKEKPLDLMELVGFIKGSSYVISNDTGPAHMAAHLGAQGITLFGTHTTAYKVSIETKNFKAIQVSDLTKLKVDKVFSVVNPDALLVLGDTNSCLSAYPAKRRKIPIFHMEAGNRCFDDRVPEEINRRIVDHISDINMPYSSAMQCKKVAEVYSENPELIGRYSASGAYLLSSCERIN